MKKKKKKKKKSSLNLFLFNYPHCSQQDFYNNESNGSCMRIPIILCVIGRKKKPIMFRDHQRTTRGTKLGAMARVVLLGAMISLCIGPSRQNSIKKTL